MDIKNRIYSVIEDTLSDKEKIELSEEKKFIEDLEYDSVRFMGMFFALEQEFDIQIISSDKNYMFFSIVTINDLIEAIDSVVNQK